MSRSVSALLVIASALAPPSGLEAGEGPVRERPGRLIWGDPPPGSGQSPRLLVEVKDADGTPTLVAVDEAVAERAGGSAVPLKAIGTHRWVSLMCKFADVADEPADLDYFVDMYGDEPGRLDHYFKELSYGAMTVAGSTASGWHDLPGARGDYGFPSEFGNLAAVFDDCVAAADPFVDFSAYDGINLMINDLVGCCAFGTRHTTTLDGVTRTWGLTWNPPWAWAGTAVVAHEMGHGLGLPHVDNADGDGDPYDNPWDVMSDALGWVVADGVYGARGKHTTAHHKDHLGWIPAAKKLTAVAGSQVVTIDRLETATATHHLVAEIPVDANRSYTVEVREPFGEYDGALADKAVLVHEVDVGRRDRARLLDAGEPPADYSDGEGVMWKTGEVFCRPDELLQVEVLGETADGFQVRIDSGVTDNCPPLSAPDVFATVANDPLEVPAPGVLANDRDQNPADVLSAAAVSGASHGTAALAADGSLSYLPASDFLGDDQLVYRASDGTAESIDTPVVVRVLAPDYALETGEGDVVGAIGIDDFAAVGVKFELFLTTTLTRVGASLRGESGTIYAAITALDPVSDLPADPTLGSALFWGVAAPPPVRQDVAFPTSVELPPGRYALILGSGLFGASGAASLGFHEAGSGTPEYLFGDPFVPYFADLETSSRLRFFVDGSHHCTGLLDADGDGLVNGCDACFGGNASGDLDDDGYCADTDCDDGDPTNTSPACTIFRDGFESGDTSAWS